MSGSHTYLVTYKTGGERYSVYLNAKSTDDAAKEIKARESHVIVEAVKRTGRDISAR